MSMRKIVILSVTGALVLAGTLAAVAMLNGDRSPDSPPDAMSSPGSPAVPSPDQTATSPGGGSSPSPVPPTGQAGPPASGPVPPPTAGDPPGYQPNMVTPRAGMDNVHRIAWRRAEVVNERTVRVHYESGVAPCSVLDRVEVQYGANITISLFEGSDPGFEDAVCIMIAQFKAVDVPLDEPVNGRPIVDGSA